IYRFIHIDNLPIYLQRGGLHAPNHSPTNGLIYKTIHNVEIQDERRKTKIPRGPGGVIHDYVGFYFGYLSPMLLQLHTGRVEEYNEGQEPLIYLVSSVQDVVTAGNSFVFSDGHGIAAFTDWYDDLNNLDQVDFDIVYKRYWKDRLDDMDRQRRKQAEFLVYRLCDWDLIKEVGVLNDKMKGTVEKVFSAFPHNLHRPVIVRRNWYYY
ncbi:DUF4433 domain-containing protein, partial [bacterium]|nr:DUF4433 domain-containing protein [bacterium]